MAYQQQVFFDQAYGVTGDIYSKGPNRVQPFILNTSSAANNVIGRAFTVVSQGVAAAGGTSVFAGFLINSKEYASFGTPGAPLAPTLTLPNGVIVNLMTMGSLWVVLPAAAAIGDLVVYNTTTGVLSTIAPGDPLASGTAFANAVVDIFTVTAAGLAVITTTTVPVPPVPAGP